MMDPSEAAVDCDCCLAHKIANHTDFSQCSKMLLAQLDFRAFFIFILGATNAIVCP